MGNRSTVNLKKNAFWLLSFAMTLWVIEVINASMGHRLNVLGVNPATSSPFPGIFFAPLLHGSFSHIALNTFPLLTLGWLVSLKGFSRFILISLFIIVTGGLGVWVFGRDAYHVGASGLIFGYFAYLLAQGVFDQSFTSVFIACSILAVYGGMIFGVLPLSGSVSWESHLFSLLSGVIASRIWAQSSRAIS